MALVEPTHFDESLEEVGHVIGDGEEGHKFQIGRGGHDKFDDLSESEDCAIVVWDCLRRGRCEPLLGCRLCFS